MAMAQQETMYTHYMYNVMAVNPAYAGYEKQLNTTLLHRSQWVSFPGAPYFQTFSIQAPLGKNVGGGLSFVNEHDGPERNIGIKGYYSYTLRSEEKLKITFGLKAGINMLQIGLRDLALVNPDDPVFMNNTESAFLPNFGFGIFAYTDTYYMGFSVPDLIQHDYLNNTIFSSSDLTLESKKYFFIAGASYPISDKIVVKPSTFMSMSMMEADTANLTVVADLTAIFVFDNKFAGGVMLRSNHAIAFLVGMILTPEFEFGYSFDLLYSNPTARYNGGSHEIVVKYRLNRRNVNRGPLPCPTFL